MCASQNAMRIMTYQAGLQPSGAAAGVIESGLTARRRAALCMWSGCALRPPSSQSATAEVKQMNCLLRGHARRS